MSKSPDLDFKIRWLPFQLNAASAEEPASRTEKYMEKFGKTREEVMGFFEVQMKGSFEKVGLPYHAVDGEIFVANSREAHRVITAAYKEGGQEAQDKAVEVLFYGYFGEGKPPNEPTLLEAAAVAAGLDPSLVADRSMFAAELDEELAEWRPKVKTGVPHVIIRPEDGEAVTEFYGMTAEEPVEQMLAAFAVIASQ